MKVEKFKVLLYLKKSGLDKSGKAPIMGRITVNRTMAQFSCKLSCTPDLWNPRESRLNGKSKEAVEVNAKIDKLLLAVNSAFDSLLERKTDFDADYILNLWNLYDTNEDSACEEQDQDIFNGILLIVAIYYKYTQTNGYFDFGDYVAAPEQIQYTYSVRPDMLNLYKMFHEKKKTKNNTITIEYNKQKIELTNDDNWFLNMITPYLDKYLGIPSLEEAEAELNKDYPTTGKRGRKRENAILDTVTLSIYNLLRHSSFAAKGKGLTDNEGKFILSLLVYLRLIDEDSSKNDILNLRATIRNLQKYEVRPNWWRIPMCKTSPNNPVEHLKSYW